MYPKLIEIGPVTLYSYGMCIALGAIMGFLYMARQGHKQFGTSFDRSNSLFLWLVLSGVVGGKVFLFFENPSHYLNGPAELFSGSGFVFFGSLLLCIPTMLLFFRHYHIPVRGMLDIMAIVTLIVHGFGRVGCFLAGCCYGIPTDSILGVTFTSESCQARPLGVPLHPTQLYEASFLFVLLGILWFFSPIKKFDGQIFLLYLMSYAAGRSVLEIFQIG
ncbi:MAG: prolipoprotein diacylglyceryl transferase, partial [Cyclobacteriaceae bacterium]|nr:prolipoprotein diacylglyceryl transferase [Cyclobacteriaceae bacterium]